MAGHKEPLNFGKEASLTLAGLHVASPPLPPPPWWLILIQIILFIPSVTAVIYLCVGSPFIIWWKLPTSTLGRHFC